MDKFIRIRNKSCNLQLVNNQGHEISCAVHNKTSFQFCTITPRPLPYPFTHQVYWKANRTLESTFRQKTWVYWFGFFSSICSKSVGKYFTLFLPFWEQWLCRQIGRYPKFHWMGARNFSSLPINLPPWQILHKTLESTFYLILQHTLCFAKPL